MTGNLPTSKKSCGTGKHSRFTYGVRPSSTEFFDELVCYIPHATPDEVASVSKLVADQSWFFLHWRLDPTIQSVLVMLDAIHVFFKSSVGLLIGWWMNEWPAISFELLPLEHFGLTDDLYIKMNARGKPLTSFETFKARFEKLLIELFPTETREIAGGQVSIAEFFERRMDTQWTDLFWAYKNPQTNTFDEPVMNLLRAVALVSLDPTSPGFIQDTMLLRDRQFAGTFSLFHEHGWLSRNFANNIINLLEVWSRNYGKLAPILSSPRYFDERTFFQNAIHEPAALEYTRLTQFAAFVIYLRHHEGNVQPASLNEWMRVVRNLATNTEIERPEEYRRSLEGLNNLLPFSGEILERLSDTDINLTGFSPQQLREESLKARLILADVGWRDRIGRAEEHGYFSGQIEFLLGLLRGPRANGEDAGEVGQDSAHKTANILRRIFHEGTDHFYSSGLAPTKPASGAHLWKRALLAVGDYLHPAVVTIPSLRIRRGIGTAGSDFYAAPRGARQFLKSLWDRIDIDSDIEPQLEQIIASAASVEPWRAAIIRHPEVISYCGQQEMRRAENGEEIYLLTKKQMSGYHAELFSYVLHLELADAGVSHNLTPLKLQPYEAVYWSEIEPYVHLVLNRSNHRVNF